MATPYTTVYDSFMSKITDDMYLEISPEETILLQKELFESAIHWFEFPRFNSSARNNDEFTIDLTPEEVNIISTYMVVEWLGQQLATIELTRMKYSGTDFKFTSQANHMAKLSALKDQYIKDGFHLQRLYKRRKANKDGIMKSTFGQIMSTPD